MFNDDDVKNGTDSLILGPAYFDARRVAERFMAKFEAEQFKPLIDKMAETFSERLWADLQSSMLSDIEMNIQGEIWRMVDNCVEALLSGNGWALEKYVLAGRYNDAEIRAMIAKHIPAEIQDARIADLEKENARLNDSLSRIRRY